MDWSRAGGSVAIEEVALGWRRKKINAVIDAKLAAAISVGETCFAFLVGNQPDEATARLPTTRVANGFSVPGGGRAFVFV